jgi:hypothetical protein
MVVDMLTEALAACNHDWVVAGAQSPDDRGDAGMRDDERRLPEERVDLVGQEPLVKPHVGPGRNRVGMAVLDDKLGVAGERQRCIDGPRKGIVMGPERREDQ